MQTQHGISISAYLLKVENERSEISELNAEEKINEVKTWRILISGFEGVYKPYLISVQGWSIQPSVEELERFLSNQETQKEKKT